MKYLTFKQSAVYQQEQKCYKKSYYLFTLYSLRFLNKYEI